MDAAKTLRVKICGIVDKAEAETAIAAGADAVGMVEGANGMTLADIAEIVANVPPGVSGFLVTTETNPKAINEKIAQTHVDVVQLVEWVDHKAYTELRKAHPAIKIAQVVQVLNETALDEAEAIGELVDAIFLDASKKPDWTIGQRVREISLKPVYLSGGVTHDNAVYVASKVKPFGIDVIDDVRTDGKLDAAKLAALFASVRQAEAAL